MWGKPKILLLHVPIYVNICKSVSEMNKEARWTEYGCRGGYENCVQYFSRNTQIKASFRRRRHGSMRESEVALNTFAASYLNIQGLNNSCLKSPASTLVDLTFQSRTLRSFSLNQLRNLSL